MAHVARVGGQRRIVVPQEVLDHLEVSQGDMVMFKLLSKSRAILVAADVQPKSE